MFDSDKEIYHVLNSIIDDSEGQTSSFCYLKNSSGKEWLFSDCSKKILKLGLNIYEPQVITGKLIKGFLPFLYKYFEQRNTLGIKKVNAKVKYGFLNLLSQIYKVEASKIHLSIFLGTPSVHQKIVVQVDDGNKILGYAKLSNNIEVIDGFKRETARLCDLKKKGLSNIPDALYCGMFEDVGVFVQSSQKEKYAYSDSTVNKCVISFVGDLMQKTKKKIRWEDSDYYSLISIEEIDLKSFPVNSEELIKAISITKEKHKGEDIVLYASHGDFTPWNSFYNKKNDLHTFDFEYSMESCTAFYDLYHWFVSDCIYRKHYNYVQIIKAFDKSEIKKCIKNSEQGLVLYLLGIICFYIKRDGNNSSIDTKKNMETWSRLLAHYGSFLYNSNIGNSKKEG